MVWPLVAIGAIGIGAFVGAQVDDAIESPATLNPLSNSIDISPTKIAYYAVLGGVSYFALSKSGILKRIIPK